MSRDSGEETSLEIKQGELLAIPLPIGEYARLQLTPLQQHDIGMGSPGRGGGLRVTGSAFGVVIDARGRPIRLPDNLTERRKLMAAWSEKLRNPQPA
jgi:hypothetical protein